MRNTTITSRQVIATSVILLVAATGSLLSPQKASAVPVPLQNPTATVEQGGFPITDSLIVNTDGWATSGNASIGVYEVVTPISSANNIFTFSLQSQGIFADHVLGKFRLSVTTDALPLSAGIGNWTVLTPTSASAINSNPVTVLAGNVLEATDVNAATDTITVTSQLNSVGGITGFRLEAIQGGIGSVLGPGLAGNNNFVLNYFAVDVEQVPVPEPSSFLLLGIGVLGMARHARRRRRA